MNLLYIAPTPEINFSKAVKKVTTTKILLKQFTFSKVSAPRTGLNGYCSNYFSQKKPHGKRLSQPCLFNRHTIWRESENAVVDFSVSFSLMFCEVSHTLPGRACSA